LNCARFGSQEKAQIFTGLFDNEAFPLLNVSGKPSFYRMSYLLRELNEGYDNAFGWLEFQTRSRLGCTENWKNIAEQTQHSKSSTEIISACSHYPPFLPFEDSLKPCQEWIECNIEQES
jgi:hypothetical protein